MDKVQVFDIYGRAGFVWFQLRHVVAYGFHGAVPFLWFVILLDKSIPSLVSDCILSVAVRTFNPAARPVGRVSVQLFEFVVGPGCLMIALRAFQFDRYGFLAHADLNVRRNGLERGQFMM